MLTDVRADFKQRTLLGEAEMQTRYSATFLFAAAAAAAAGGPQFLGSVASRFFTRVVKTYFDLRQVEINR